jgi:glycosyltransferase involved in cell wall biosynthesis
MKESASQLVSVIIPVYNGARFIAKALDSILNQTYLLTEIIVVDDGSTDSTQEICRRYSNVSYIYQFNQGVNAARNRGLQESRGKFLVFLDHDDRLLPNAIATGIMAATDHPETAFVFGLTRMVNVDGGIINDAPTTFAAASYELLLKAELRIAPPSTVLFRRDVLEKLQGFDPTLRLAEDYEIYLRIAREFPIYCHNQVIVEYLCHQHNASGSVMPMMAATLQVLDAQQPYIEYNSRYRKAYKIGKKHWVTLWMTALASRVNYDLKNHQFIQAIKKAFTVLFYRPRVFFKYLIKHSLIRSRALPTKTVVHS